jgi:hypothetical protein
MSYLISRILLAILMLPLAGLAYVITFAAWIESSNYYPNRERLGWVFGGGVAWIFMAVWWYLLWRGSVRWTPQRRVKSLASMGLAAVAGIFVGGATWNIDDDLGCFTGSVAAPILWLCASCFIWRETAIERTERVRSGGKGAIVCPTCGYNLTGLKEARCPECGAIFTIDELVAAQPALAPAELEH